MIDGTPEFQLNFTTYTKGMNPFQILPYNSISLSKSNENSFPHLVIDSTEKDLINIS